MASHDHDLERQAPVMRRAGWVVDELDAGHDNAKRWRVRRPEKAGIQHSQHSQHSQEQPENGTGASVASVASVENGQSQDEHPTCDDCGGSLYGADLLTRSGRCSECERGQTS